MIYEFTASRISGDKNMIFPDRITINKNNDTLVYKKGTLLGYKSKTLRLAAIGCVSMSEGILFRDIIIETNGGQQIAAKGFLVSDAKQIVKILSDF
jgi:hypothetical protein